MANSILRAPFRLDPAAPRTQQRDERLPAQTRPAPSQQPAQSWVKAKQAPAAKTHAEMGSLSVDDFAQLFSEGWIDVKDLQKRANMVGRGPEIAKAIAAADLDGDGKLSGDAEARALFKALDKYD